jgi:predicted TIM-barrel enzyme
MIEPRPIGESARIAFEEKADALVITGSTTGNAPLAEDLRSAAAGSPLPVLIGSGLDSSNASDLLDACDGAIVGTALMRDRILDADAVDKLMSALGRMRQ